MVRNASHRGALISRLTVAALVLAASLLPAQAEARYSALVMDADSGEVLFSRHADTRRYPASLTKMMTLYMVFEALDQGTLQLQQPLTVSRRAEGQAPSRLGLRAGETITVDQAILATVTRSANDVATVLAEALADTEFRFALKMTERARALGMTRSTFRNASGLPDRRQRSTARDMATLALALQRDYPQYYRYFSVPSFSYGKRTYRNHNNLLGSYQGTDGIKTGYIRASGFNLVASVRRDGRWLIGVVFGGRSAKSRDAHMRSIISTGFSRLRKQTAAAEKVATTASRESTAPKPAAGSATSPAVATKAVARAVPAGWQVQVGAYYQFGAAERRAREAVKRAAGVLSGAVIIAVEPMAASSGRTMYRARLVKLSRSEARNACRLLEQQKFDCLPLAPTS